MTHENIILLLEEAAAFAGHSFNRYALNNAINLPPSYGPDELEEVISYLGNMAYKARMTQVSKALTVSDIRLSMTSQEQHLLVFLKPTSGSDSLPYPYWLSPAQTVAQKDNLLMGRPVNQPDAAWRVINADELFAWGDEMPPRIAGKVPALFYYPLTDITSEHQHNPAPLGAEQHANIGDHGHADGHHAHGHDAHKHLHPFARLMMLFKPDRKDIWFIYVFAISVALINLTLPLGTQAIIGLISGGMVFNSVIILISMVVMGVVVGGGLQIMQLSIVEILQRRVFARASFEFAYRVPRFTLAGLGNSYAPEQMNRFFEVLTIQKAIPKLLIDLTAALLQVVFGLLLLGFYHPFFVIFGVFLLSMLLVFLIYYAPKGLNSSIQESKYKYKVIAWFQDMARALIPFKMTGNSNLSVSKTDEYVNQYLYYRKKHFGLLITQYGGILIFKASVTAGLLIIGTYLVVDRQITLGQFVASEIVIITVLSAVEKIILTLEVVYDALTAVDKLGHITDLPLEHNEGINLPSTSPDKGTYPLLEVKDLSFKYGDYHVLHSINFRLMPGQHLSIAGGNGSGKHTLVKIILGLYPDYKGEVVMNRVSLRDANLSSLRNQIGENAINCEFFEGTIYDNIAMGRPGIVAYRVSEVLEDLGIASVINQLPNGLYTNLSIGTPVLNGTALYCLTLARTLVNHPKLVIIDDELQKLSQADKLRILSYLQNPKHNWAVIYLSNDPLIQAACSQVIHLQKGRVDLVT